MNIHLCMLESAYFIRSYSSPLSALIPLILELISILKDLPQKF